MVLLTHISKITRYNEYGKPFISGPSNEITNILIFLYGPSNKEFKHNIVRTPMNEGILRQIRNHNGSGLNGDPHLYCQDVMDDTHVSPSGSTIPVVGPDADGVVLLHMEF